MIVKGGFLRPKRPDWFIAGTAIGVGSLVLGAIVDWWRGWSSGDWWGMSFGIAATMLMIVAALYPLRRRLTVWPLRTAQAWLQFHVYGSTLAATFVLIHIGFHWPAGQFGWWLLGLTLWTTASGLLGVMLQKWVPVLLADQLTVEAIFERIPELVASRYREAETLMKDAPDVMQRFYASQVRASLAQLTPSWSYLVDAHSGHERRLSAFHHIEAFIPDQHRDRLADLQTLVIEKFELDAHFTLQRLLRLWPILHVPPAMCLLAAIAVHVAAVVYY
ncbi:MAG TPA: hypothetical protein VGY57_10100 [Vicinamibacterales bacterium]|jgi:hypothetical protein|nr:hypothetical protein [Vicinamibacterales bacterium]